MRILFLGPKKSIILGPMGSYEQYYLRTNILVGAIEIRLKPHFLAKPRKIALSNVKPSETELVKC